MIKSLLFAIGAATLAAMSASAVPVNITVNSLGLPLNGNGTADADQYGQVDASSVSELSFLNHQISLWNAVYDPDLPVAGGSLAFDDGTVSGISYTALSGFDYAVFHFEQGSSQTAGGGGSLSGLWQAWSLNGAGGSFMVPIVSGQPFGSFASARYYNRQNSSLPSVPDAGGTFALLGIALGAIETLRRKFVRA